MRIVKYENVLPFIGYIEADSRGSVRYYFADIDHRLSSTKKISIDDLLVADLNLYKTIHKLLRAKSELENLQAYFEYIDIKYPTYSYY